MTEFDQNSETKIGLDGLPNSFQMNHEFTGDGIRSAIAEVQSRVSKLATLAAANGDFVLPHQSTYVSQIEFASKTYWSRFDEALRAGYNDALAMRRDPFIHMLMRHRQTPTGLLEHTLVADGKFDPEKQKTVEQVRRVFESTPRFQAMKMILLESIFYGKYGVELSFKKKWIDGRDYFVVSDFRPVHGDKIIFKYDGTPGIFVYPKIASLIKDSRLGLIEQADIGPALFLKTPFWRRRFIIHEFEPTDTDYMFEADMGGSVHGVGLRGRLFWGWYQRKEILAWACDAMQKISTNGALIGYYPTGEEEAKKSMIAALKQIQQYGFAVAAVEPSMSGAPSNSIQHIEPAAIAYDVLMKFIEYQDSILRQAVLGQDLSTSAAPTGLGSGVAELQGQVRSDFILYDANNLAERLECDLIGSLIAFNSWDYAGRIYNGWLPFDVKLKFVTDRQDVDNRLKAAQTMVAQLGIDIDKDKLLEEVGFSSPRTEEASVLASMQAAQMAMMQPGQGQLPPPGQGPPPTDAEVPQEGEQPAAESQSLPPTQDEEDESRIVRYSMGDNLGTATAPKAKAPQPAAAPKAAPKQPAQTQEFREFKPTKNDPKLNLNISQPLTIGGKEFKGTVEHGTPQYRHILDRASVHEYEGENHQRQAAGIGEAHEIEHLQHHLRHGDPKKFPAQLESLYDPYKSSHESPLGHNAVAKLYPGRKDGPNLSPSKEEAKGTVRKLPIPESVSFKGINGKIRKLEAGRTVERHGPDYSELLENADPHVLASAPFAKDFNKHQIVSHMMRRHRNALTSEQNAQEHNAAKEKKGKVKSALKEVEEAAGQPVDKNAAYIQGKQIENQREVAAEKQGELPFAGIRGRVTRGDVAAVGLRRDDAQTKLSPGKTAKDRAENAKNDEIERQGTAFLKEAEARKKATANQSAPTEQKPLGRPPGPALAEAEATTAPEAIEDKQAEPTTPQPTVQAAPKAEVAQAKPQTAANLDKFSPQREFNKVLDASLAKGATVEEARQLATEAYNAHKAKITQGETSAPAAPKAQVQSAPVAEPKAAEPIKAATPIEGEVAPRKRNRGPGRVPGTDRETSAMATAYELPTDMVIGGRHFSKGTVPGYKKGAGGKSSRNPDWNYIVNHATPEERAKIDPHNDRRSASFIPDERFEEKPTKPFVHVGAEPKAVEQVSAAPSADDTIKRFPEEIAPVKASEEIKPAETQADIDISEGVDDVQPDAGKAEQQRIAADQTEWKEIDPKLRREYLKQDPKTLDPDLRDHLWYLLDDQWEKFSLKKQVEMMDLLQRGKLTPLSDEWLRQRIQRDSIDDWEANSSDADLKPESGVPQFKDRKERSKPDRPKAKLFDPENSAVAESADNVRSKQRPAATDKGFGELRERESAKFDPDEVRIAEEGKTKARAKGKPPAKDAEFGELREKDAALLDPEEAKLADEGVKSRVKTAPTAKSEAALEPSKPFDADKTEIGRTTFSPEAVTKANLSDEETRDFVRFMKSHRSESGNIETLRDFVGDDATDRLIQALGYDGIKQSKWKNGDKVAPPPTTRAFLPTEPPKQEPQAAAPKTEPTKRPEPKQEPAARSAQAKAEQKKKNIDFLLKTPFEKLSDRHQKALLNGPREDWPKEVQDYLDAAEIKWNKSVLGTPFEKLSPEHQDRLLKGPRQTWPKEVQDYIAAAETKRNKNRVAERVKTGEVARRQEAAKQRAEFQKTPEGRMDRIGKLKAESRRLGDEIDSLLSASKSQKIKGENPGESDSKKIDSMWDTLDQVDKEIDSLEKLNAAETKQNKNKVAESTDANPDRTKEILSRLRELSDKSEAAKQKNSASRDASGFNKIMARVDQLLNKSKREKLKAAERDESERLLAELDSLLKKEQGRKN